MIQRELSVHAKSLFERYPVLTVTGPRQSGKTTLVRQVFENLPYVNLEDLATREFAETDPVGFVRRIGKGAVIDEIQRVPKLLSQIQVHLDEARANGIFVLTGSSQLQMMEAVSQSLAGRTALLKLLPFSLLELSGFGGPFEVDELIYRGFYPRIWDQKLNPTQALGDYFETYVERDVRDFAQIRDLSVFRRFVRLCAGRIGGLINLSSLSGDTGVSSTTIKHWLSIMEASHVIFLLQPFHANIRKRLVKAPKLYFYDVGLASFLLGLESASQVETHYLRGGLFENLTILELIKHRFNQGKRLNMSFYRDSKGNEVDLLVESAGRVIPVEIKSGMTVSQSHFKGFETLRKVLGESMDKPLVVYAGVRDEERSAGAVTNLERFRERLSNAGV